MTFRPETRWLADEEAVKEETASGRQGKVGKPSWKKGVSSGKGTSLQFLWVKKKEGASEGSGAGHLAGGGRVISHG